MREEFEFFKKAVEITGKHSAMAAELWRRDEPDKSYFKRLIDLYILAPVIGFRMNRKAEEDRSDVGNRSIYLDQILKEKDKLDTIMQTIILLEYAEGRNQDEYKEIVNKSFRGAETKEEYDMYNKLFHDYMRGGIEYMYEKLIVQKPDLDGEYHDEMATSLMEFARRFSV